MKRTALVLIGISALASIISASAEAAGPWNARVVDAETGQPLEGVVVLVYWIKYTSSWGGWAGGEFHDSEEVVTGTDGRFVIQARSTWTLLPWKKISGPEFVIFKPGYGQWRFQGYEAWRKLSLAEQDAQLETTWKQFTGDGVVIELPPLKTREERVKFYHTLSWAPDVPAGRTRRLREAEDVERAYLGFRKMHERKR